LRANTLARGHSGVRVEVVEKILEHLNHDVIPIIPQQGSVGASGDLAPLSHLALALIGEGDVWGGSYKEVKPLEL
jgi:histidine ammonia-lyase